MPRIPGTTDAQSAFLRSFRQSATPAWPAPSILRRWLRRPEFRAALKSVRQTLRYQADFHLAAAAATASKLLAADPAANDVGRLTTLLRAAHLRQRFPDPTEPASPATFALRAETARTQAYLQTLEADRDPDDDEVPDADEDPRPYRDRLHYLRSLVTQPGGPKRLDQRGQLE
jgi:hypothetical protein